MFSSRVFSASLLAVLLALLAANDAAAQRRGGGGGGMSSSYYGSDNRLEIVGYGAYRWTFSIGASRGLTTGDLDIKDSGIWGVALDINVPAPDTQVRLVYDRQDSKYQYKSLVPAEEDGSVEYLHIGAVKGIRQGNVLPYGLFTLGATRYAADSDDAWKFSIMLGLGAKVYLNERLGIMAQARLPYTFLSGGLGFGIGTGGASVGLVGTGLAQLDVGGGLVLLL